MVNYNKKSKEETKDDFFNTKIDQTPYQSFWIVVASSLFIILVVIYFLWSLAGTIKREIRIRFPNIYNFSLPLIDLPKIPDKITLPNFNTIIEDQSGAIQKNIKNDITDTIQNQTDKLKP